MPPYPSSATSIHWQIKPVSIAGQIVQIARLHLNLFFQAHGRRGPSLLERAWLDTAAPLSVIPYHAYSQGLTWHSLGGNVTWLGQPCTLGRVSVWLPAQSGGQFIGPYSLLAKFPHRDPPGVSAPILLGLEFVLSYQAAVHLPPAPLQGSLQFP